MSGQFYYRDPRRPRDIQGPLTIDQLRDRVRDGALRPGDQVSIDGHAWLMATELEPELFPAASSEWLAARPAWKRALLRAVDSVKRSARVAWRHVRIVIDFYWSQRRELRQLATEYLSFLKEPSNRREIRVSADDQNDTVTFDGDQWHAELPDCCVVCGESADCDWNSEQRSVPELTWPMAAPLLGVLIALIGWVLLWNSLGRWLIPVGLVLGFLAGYRFRGETVVTVRFRRCRNHLNRTRFPSLRTFGKTLIIGVGDRKVWRLFYYGDRGLETPAAVPPDFSKIVESGQARADDSEHSGPTYPTIPLADSPDPAP